MIRRFCAFEFCVYCFPWIVCFSCLGLYLMLLFAAFVSWRLSCCVDLLLLVVWFTMHFEFLLICV